MWTEIGFMDRLCLALLLREYKGQANMYVKDLKRQNTVQKSIKTLKTPYSF